MIITHNLSAQNSIRHMNRNSASTGTAMQRLSSGLRINSAKDDAAGLAISESMRSQVRGLTQASRNSQDGVSLAQTAEGTLNEVQSMLQRMRELAVQAANDTNDSVNKGNLFNEYEQLTNEIGKILDQAKYNGQTLFAMGSPLMTKGLNFQVGANTGELATISCNGIKIVQSTMELDTGYYDQTGEVKFTTTNTEAAVSYINAQSLSLDQVKFYDSSDDYAATKGITTIDNAITYISKVRSKLGAIQNRMEYRANANDNTAENLQAAESRIRDTDMAQEMTNYTQSNILTQAAQAMLAQANQNPQNVLSLLR